MDTAYLICALVGGTLITCQFLLTLVGLGGHHDAGGGHDMAGHDAGGHDAPEHDTEHHGEAHGTNWFLGVLTFRTVTAGVAFFGLTGLILNRSDVRTEIEVAGAVAAGLAAIFAVSWLMRNLSQLNIDGTLPLRKAVGAAGTVYLSIPANKAGAGKVHVTVAGRLVEYKAVTEKDDLPTGSKVVVVAIVNADTVEVMPTENIENTERVHHG